VVVLEQRVVPEAGNAGAGGGTAPARRLRVVPEVPLEEVEGDLVLGEAHLYDAARVGGGVVGVLVVGFPPGEVGGVLAVETGRGHLRQGSRRRRRRRVALVRAQQQLATHGRSSALGSRTHKWCNRKQTGLSDDDGCKMDGFAVCRAARGMSRQGRGGQEAVMVDPAKCEGVAYIGEPSKITIYTRV